MSIDWNNVASLLHAAEKTTQWPTLHGIRDRALHELDEVNVEASKEMKEIRDKIAKAAAEAQAKLEAEAQKAAAGAETPAAQSTFASRQTRFTGTEAT